jgi:hypothetical protein
MKMDGEMDWMKSNLKKPISSSSEESESEDETLPPIKSKPNYDLDAEGPLDIYAD